MYRCTNKRRWNITCIIVTTIIVLIVANVVRADNPVQYKKIIVTDETPTIDQIINAHYISNDIGRERHEIIEHNNLKGKRFWIHIGQEIEIPIKENMR